MRLREGCRYTLKLIAYIKPLPHKYTHILNYAVFWSLILLL